MNNKYFKQVSVAITLILLITLVCLRLELFSIQFAITLFSISSGTAIITMLLGYMLNAYEQKKKYYDPAKVGELDMQTESRAQAILAEINPAFLNVGIQNYKFFILDLSRKQFSQIHGEGTNTVQQNHSLAFVSEHFKVTSLSLEDALFEKMPEVMALDIKLLMQQLNAEQIFVLRYNNSICGFLSFPSELSKSQLESIRGILSKATLTIFHSLQLNYLSGKPVQLVDKELIPRWVSYVVIAWGILMTLYWLLLPVVNQFFNTEKIFITDFANIYGLICFIGIVVAFKIARAWKNQPNLSWAISMFGVGLLLQEFGQLSYAVCYSLWGIQIPYPSVGDIGYFGSIPCYILALIFLGKALGVQLKLKKVSTWILGFLVPLLFLAIGYWLFLQGYEFNWTNPLRVFLDFGYPVFQAIYVSIAILIYLYTRDSRGAMKNKVRLIVFAMVWQFLCDYIFLYQASKGVWMANGWNDLMYLFSYCFFTFILISISKELPATKR